MGKQKLVKRINEDEKSVAFIGSFFWSSYSILNVSYALTGERLFQKQATCHKYITGETTKQQICSSGK